MHENLINKKILITGGSGFVGTNLINRLLEMGCSDIRATTYSSPAYIKDERVSYTKVDLINSEDCKRICKDIDYVIMCAAHTHGAAYMDRYPLSLVTPNVVMNTYMMEAAYENNVKKVIFISSSVVYPMVDHSLEEHEMLSGPVFDKYYGVFEEVEIIF